MEGTFLGQDTRRRVVGIARARSLGQSFTRERTEIMIDNLNAILDNMNQEIENRTQVSREEFFRIERNMVRTAIRNLNRHLYRLRGQGGVFSRANRIAPEPDTEDISSVGVELPESEREDVIYEPENILRRTEPYERDPDVESINRDFINYGYTRIDPRIDPRNRVVSVLGLDGLSNPDIEVVGETFYRRRGTNTGIPYILTEGGAERRQYPRLQRRARINEARRMLQRNTTLPDELMDNILEYL